MTIAAQLPNNVREITALTNETAVRTDDEPDAPELVDVLAEDLARPAIVDVVVERPATVRDLTPAVGTLPRSEQGGLDTRGGLRTCADEVGRPRRGACAAARAASAGILREGVQPETAPVEQDLAVLRRPHRDR